jgi:hypothetical protein
MRLDPVKHWVAAQTGARVCLVRERVSEGAPGGIGCSLPTKERSPGGQVAGEWDVAILS